MSFRVKTLRPWLLLAIGALAWGLAPCPAAKPYEPVLGDPMFEDWRWRNFPELTGLDVSCMAQSSDGTLWFGTANNLWSYDGIDWTRHTNGLGHIVTTLCVRADGTIFAGGGWGVSQFKNGQWTPIFPLSEGRIVNITDIAIKKFALGRDGALWVATHWGAMRYDSSGWTLYTNPETAARLRTDRNLPPIRFEFLPETILSRMGAQQSGDRRCEFYEVCADQQGRIWLGTATGEVLRHTPASAATTPGEWALYGESEGVSPGYVSSILPLRDGSIWVSHAASEQADIFDGQSWRPLRLPLHQPALDLGDVGGKLIQTRDGVVWLLARYALFAYRNGSWRKYSEPDLPYPSTRNVVMQSADGAIWFSGPNSEIFRVDYQTARWLTLEDLNFQWESPTGAEWFLHRDGRVVMREGERWISYGPEDGLIDTPVTVLGARNGEVWAAGSHQGAAATARFDGQKWTREIHENFSFAIDWRAVFESSDGSLWFGAFVDTDGPPQFRDGILQYRSGKWIHHYQPGRSPHPELPDDPSTLLPASTNPDRPIEKFICFGESRDGKIWAGRNILAVYDGTRWERFQLQSDMRWGNVESTLSTREGELWVGTRESGAWRYNGQEWQQFQGKESLAANSVRSLAQTADGSIWAVTDRGSSRFDGSTWMSNVLPNQLYVSHEGGNLKATPSGNLWINRFTLHWMRRAWPKSPPPAHDAEFRTFRHQFRGEPPRTTITSGAKTIAQPGNLAVLWSGVMPWREPNEARLQFSYRLDGQPWSPFTSDRGHSFFTLPDGQHHLEVRARDADFNVDPTPAVLDFVVLPPVWRQGWFILLMLLLSGLIVAQTIRVLLEQGRLRRAHDELEARVRQRTAELETANRELAAANRELEAFSYSVSHDLRAPLRSIDGFSSGLLEDYGALLDADGKEDLNRVRSAAQRMGQLIDDMLKLSRVTRGDLRITPVDISALIQEIANELAQNEPQRRVHWLIAPNVVAQCDGNLLRIALENLVRNAWKFTAKNEAAEIEFGVTERFRERVYFVRDNGAGFDMAFAEKLFGAFQRLHSPKDFPGTGVGLAIVQRVILRHGGRVWAEGKEGAGATFFFTLGEQIEAPQ